MYVVGQSSNISAFTPYSGKRNDFIRSISIRQIISKPITIFILAGLLVVVSLHFLWCQNAVQISHHGKADQAIKMCFSFTSKVWWQKLKASERIETSSRERKWLPLLLQNGHVVETSCLHSRKLQGNSIWQVSPLPYNQINSLSGDEVRFHSRSYDVEHSVQSLQECKSFCHWNASFSYNSTITIL